MDTFYLKPVLRIHLILLRTLIRILDPHWKKMDPDPGHFFKIYRIFLTKNNFQLFCFIFFSLHFILKLDGPFRNEELFIISLFSKKCIWGLGVKVFFAVLGCYPLDPDVRIFLRIRIWTQEAKILRIQGIRILSTV